MNHENKRLKTAEELSGKPDNWHDIAPGTAAASHAHRLACEEWEPEDEGSEQVSL